MLRLKRLPVQKLKIDEGFVAGLPCDEDDSAIVRVIIALAQSMGMQVQAEGIQQVEQAAFCSGTIVIWGRVIGSADRCRSGNWIGLIRR